MRLLLPHIDRSRPAYGLKEVALARHYIDILNIAKESTDAQKLLHYRAPHAAKQVKQVYSMYVCVHLIVRSRIHDYVCMSTCTCTYTALGVCVYHNMSMS